MLFRAPPAGEYPAAELKVFALPLPPLVARINKKEKCFVPSSYFEGEVSFALRVEGVEQTGRIARTV